MIDPRAIIDPSAKIADNVTIGPWTMVGPGVEVGEGTEIASHVVVKGPTKIGRDNKIFQFSTIGEDTPDLKYKGEPTTLVIGDNNTFREGVTIHRGTVQDRGETRIGNDNLLMAYVHVGHDCVVGNNCILVNNASLAGHVDVGDWAILSGYSLVHQYISIGAHCFIAPGSFLYHDVPAYVMANGSPAVPRTINREGLKRRGFTAEQISLINKGYKTLYRKGHTTEEALAALQELDDDNGVLALFIQSIQASSRGIIR